MDVDAGVVRLVGDGLEQPGEHRPDVVLDRAGLFAELLGGLAHAFAGAGLSGGEAWMGAADHAHSIELVFDERHRADRSVSAYAGTLRTC